jgi:glutamate carboxypeptidase
VADLQLLVSDLQRLVDVESPSLDVEALTRSAQNLAALIAERTGREASIIEGPAGPHVHWSGGGEPRVLILGHHDTVFPLGALAERPFTITDGKATGPGVFDMKAGIVQALHAVAALEDPGGVEMLFTADEEVGSGSSRDLLEGRAAACGNVLVLEPSGDGGAVKTGRKGTGTFKVVIGGRASHAGLEPEKGVNSLIEASRPVLRIAEFGDAAAGTTVTPTVAHAGTADNVVPAETVVKVDVRVTNAAEKDRVEALMANLTVVELFPLAQAAVPGIDGVAVGGGSDGNFTAAIGVPTLDGLGAVGGGAHADHEHVIVDTMPGRVELVEGILRRLL